MIYPDPWPKRRHWKRRFVQDRSVAELPRPAAGRRVPLRHRYRGLCGVDARRLTAPRLRLERRARRRLAAAVAGFAGTRYKAKPFARPGALLAFGEQSNQPANVRIDLLAIRYGSVFRNCQNRITCAVAGGSRSKLE